MYSIIQKIYEKHNKILKEGVKKVLNGEDVSSLTGAIKDFTDVLGTELFSEIVTQIENLVFDDAKRKNQYESVRFAEKSLITKNGKTKFERRYYKDNETGENVSLTDKILGIDKGERIDKKVKAELIQKASDQSYNKSGKLVVPEMDISATTVMRNVRKNQWKMEIKERKEENKIKAKNIFIQVDEDHVKQRGKKGCTISKIITIYTRKRTLTKPDRIPEVKQVRKELVDKFTFSGLYKDTQEMWEDVEYYIDCTYKKEEIETAFVMGDGASYIKAGTEWIAKSVFVLDTFHLEKYINHLNYDEYLKTKLQEAIEQFDPISTENIMNEAIRKIEQEIKEDEQLERNTKRLENRLKKIKETKTYLMNQWQGIEAHDTYKDKLTGCCQEGQVHHTLSERLSTDAKVWSENGIEEMSQLRAFTQNGGNVYQKIVDTSTAEKREKKIEELEKRIRKKANKKLFGTTGAKIPIGMARDELYYELKNIWYEKAI
ncbi:MAG: ISLre2 family transposase [Clostridia bacterium]